MEFLRVSDGKLKITLDTGEMDKYGLSASELDYSDKAVRSAFFKILDEAKRAVDFDASGERMLIQFYPASFGGEIFVTKLGALSKNAERSISDSDRVAMLSLEEKIYRFDSLTDMLKAVVANRDIISRDSEAYFSATGAYYFFCTEKNISSLSSFSEFGVELPKNLGSYVKERARRIDASVENLIAIFN